VLLPGGAASVPASIDGRLVSKFSINASLDAGYKALRLARRSIDMVGSSSRWLHANSVLGDWVRVVEILTDGSLVDSTARIAVRSSSIPGISCDGMLVCLSGRTSSRPFSSSSDVLRSLNHPHESVYSAHVQHFRSLGVAMRPWTVYIIP
jgi:hypothetical protein